MPGVTSLEVQPTDAGPRLEPPASRADALMRRVLRITPCGGAAGVVGARRAFSTSIAVSSVRCLITYVLLPFVAPIVGLAAGIGPVLGITVGAVAIAANVVSVRRFWAADHTWRWAFTAVAAAVVTMLVVLMALDLRDLLG